MTQTTKLLFIHFICHLLLIPAILYGEWWMFLGSFIWWQFVAATAISSGYHRYFAHRAFKVGPWYKWYSQTVALFANPGPVLTWASTHRMHHYYTDTENDPHSPVWKGFWKVYTSYWGHDISFIERRALSKLLNDKSVKLFHRHYFIFVIILVVILISIDPLLFVFGYAVPVVFAFHGYGLLNAWTHRTGKPTNSALANIFTAGEGWHLNHHEDPRSWKIGKTRWQLDTASYFIRAIKK